jgi:hypothetical protein
MGIDPFEKMTMRLQKQEDSLGERDEIGLIGL